MMANLTFSYSLGNQLIFPAIFTWTLPREAALFIQGIVQKNIPLKKIAST